ncbi:hypothetical protein FHL15_001043 [Xylaria flabelliformis]|uniref:HNH nuclease domain-containing protein n=1 Tax=Xylaria flabelliformis TaxID=2512241 RepID=A0A553ICA0_9PEZI|nr:hypothetical protein FHL15_001043 [Xylaria flabelliformis]
MEKVFFCPGTVIGPDINANHIIPQINYHLYPSDQGKHDVTTTLEDQPKLIEDLHARFDARFFSIDPNTLRVHVFLRSDALTEFNGKKASRPPRIDPAALRHHHETCCIENMGNTSPQIAAIGATLIVIFAAALVDFIPGWALEVEAVKLEY